MPWEFLFIVLLLVLIGMKLDRLANRMITQSAIRAHIDDALSSLQDQVEEIQGKLAVIGDQLNLQNEQSETNMIYVEECLERVAEAIKDFQSQSITSP